MYENIANAIKKGELILFLGAGASYTSLDRNGNRLPIGNSLAEEICKKMNTGYNNESLSQVYNVAKDELGELDLLSFLESRFKFCKPSKEYCKLVKLPLKRVYTLNIDDCYENAFRRKNEGNLDVKNRSDQISEYSFNDEITTLIKLNGSITNASDGFIFSPEEYANNIIKSNNWYKELAKDMHSYTFLFIGTKLNEPLLEYHLAMFKRDNNVKTSSKGYIVTPSATSIEKLSLKNTNLVHIDATLEVLVEEIYKIFNEKIPRFIDVAKNINPYMITGNEDLNILNKITPINAENLRKNLRKDYKDRKIRDFYRGFKPTWDDIILGVPAMLHKTENFITNNLNSTSQSNNLFLIYGVAGSGKSTALKQICFAISLNKENNVYYIDNGYDDISSILRYLDRINTKPYYVCIDRIINNGYKEIRDTIVEKSSKAIFIITENTTMWEKKSKSILDSLTTGFLNISTIESEDVEKILAKLELYGNWTRLAKLPENKRRSELLNKADKQLLIGLLEITSGIGYNQIIQRDFDSIKSIDEKNLLLLASIPALENLPCNEQSLDRALLFLNPNFESNSNILSENLKGILKYDNGEISTRHRIYSQKIFSMDENYSQMSSLIISYISAFTKYPFPIVQNISKKEASIYKHLVNFKFLAKFFNNEEEKILGIYEYFEKDLEHEGLFLLQYGLALRTFSHSLKAYEKLVVAAIAYPNSPHIEHALAQQKLILAAHPSNNIDINRQQMFDQAQDSLLRLSSVDIGSFKNDRYPIVTLSRGHINYLLFISDVERAKKVAINYFNDLQKFPEYKTDRYLKDIANELMSFSFTGSWKNTIKDWDF